MKFSLMLDSQIKRILLDGKGTLGKKYLLKRICVGFVSTISSSVTYSIVFCFSRGPELFSANLQSGLHLLSSFNLLSVT